MTIMTETVHATEFLRSEGCGTISRDVVTIVSGAGVVLAAAGVVEDAVGARRARAERIGRSRAELHDLAPRLMARIQRRLPRGHGPRRPGRHLRVARRGAAGRGGRCRRLP